MAFYLPLAASSRTLADSVAGIAAEANDITGIVALADYTADLVGYRNAVSLNPASCPSRDE
jgi:hypothetical protein